MFRIDPLSRTPIYEQIIEQLEDLVLSGAISPNDPIPSVRSLSLQLKTNPNTIQKAYSELDSRGIISSVPGKGCFVCANAKNILSKRALRHIEEISELCKKLKLAGIGEEEIISAVKQAFDTNNDPKGDNI